MGIKKKKMKRRRRRNALAAKKNGKWRKAKNEKASGVA